MRLHQSSDSFQPLPEHPHAIVDLEKRNVQEGAVEVQFPIQNPHTMVEQGFATEDNDNTERGSIGNHSGKDELVVVK